MQTQGDPQKISSNLTPSLFADPFPHFLRPRWRQQAKAAQQLSDISYIYSIQYTVQYSSVHSVRNCAISTEWRGPVAEHGERFRGAVLYIRMWVTKAHRYLSLCSISRLWPLYTLSPLGSVLLILPRYLFLPLTRTICFVPVAILPALAIYPVALFPVDYTVESSFL